MDDVPLLELLIEPLVLPVDDPCEEPLFRLLPLDPDEPPVLSAASVWSSICPEACRPFCCWNFFSAALVFGPAMPSTGPALKPWSFNACCTCVTFELSLEAGAEEADDGDEEDCDEDEGDEEDCCDEEDDGDELDELIAGCCWL